MIGKAEQPTFSLEDGVTLIVKTECTAEGENSNAGGLFGYLLTTDNEFSFEGNMKTTSSTIKVCLLIHQKIKQQQLECQMMKMYTQLIQG